MLVLIDESGDPGFKVARGSTPVFVLAMVLFRTFEHAEQAAAVIAATREQLGIKPEFKFNKCSGRMRDSFFQAVTPLNFDVRALVVDKARIYSENLRTRKDRFYNYFVQMLMRYDNGLLQDAHVKIDGSGDRQFKQELAKYLRRELGDGRIKKLAFANSRNDSLIQLADMAAGAVARSYRPDDRAMHNRWREMLASKIGDVWEFN